MSFCALSSLHVDIVGVTELTLDGVDDINEDPIIISVEAVTDRVHHVGSGS